MTGSISPRRFVAYLRVSTGRQGASGLGLEAQREAVAGHIRAVDGELVHEVVEVESGKLRDRPGLNEALARCRGAGATLIIAKLDRLARNVAFVSSLMEARTDFVAVDAPYANRLMIHILAAFAEHEREMISVRTRSALAAAKARGVRLGCHGEALAKERKAAAQAFADAIRGSVESIAKESTTLQEVADKLNAGGHWTRQGAGWSPTTVKRVLSRLGISLAKAQNRPPGPCSAFQALTPSVDRPDGPARSCGPSLA